MSYQVKRSIVNIFSSIVLTGVYAVIIYNKYQVGDFDAYNIFKFWAVVILIFIPLSIVARIIIMIFFRIFNEIGTTIKNEITGNDEEAHEHIRDERDRLIDLKASRVSMVIFISGFLVALLTQLLNMDNHLFFISLIGFGLISDIVSEIKTIQYYNKGV
jgi:hypothetical protein